MYAVQGLLAVRLYFLFFLSRRCVKLAVLTASISESLCVMLVMSGSLVVKHCLALIMADVCCFAWRWGGGRPFDSHLRLFWIIGSRSRREGGAAGEVLGNEGVIKQTRLDTPFGFLLENFSGDSCRIRVSVKTSLLKLNSQWTNKTPESFYISW